MRSGRVISSILLNYIRSKLVIAGPRNKMKARVINVNVSKYLSYPSTPLRRTVYSSTKDYLVNVITKFHENFNIFERKKR